MDVKNKQQNIGFGILNIRFDRKKINPDIVQNTMNEIVESRENKLVAIGEKIVVRQRNEINNDKVAIKLSLWNDAKMPDGHMPEERHLMKKYWRAITDHTGELELTARLRQLGVTVRRTLDFRLGFLQHKEDKKWLSKPTKR